MSRVRDRQHAERLTREAAAAIGKHVEYWKWDIKLGGLSNDDHDYLETFAPLNVAGDAYEIEVALKLNVFYHKQASGALIMKMSHPDDPSGIFEVLTGDPQHDFRRRMECATIMASLHLLMKKGEANGKVGVQANTVSG